MSTRAWLLVNYPAPSDGAQSYQAQIMVNCHSKSFAIIDTVQKAELNGFGAVVDSRNLRPQFAPIKGHAAIESAARVICEYAP